MILKIPIFFTSFTPEILRPECYQCGRIVHSMMRVVKYAYGIVGKARWSHLSTSHHQIKTEPLGVGLMASAEISPSRRTNDVSLYSRENIYMKWQNQTEQ